MFKRVTRLFSPPVFETDEDKTQDARHLYVIAVGVVILGLVIMTAWLLQPSLRPDRVIVTAALVPLALGAMAVARGGNVRLASALLVGGMWSLLTLAAFTNGGVSAPAFDSYILAILCAGLLLGQRAAVGMVVLSAAASLGMLYFEYAGWMSAPPPMHPVVMWISQLVIFAAVVLLLHLTFSGAVRALARSRAEIAERRRMEDELNRRAQDMATLYLASQEINISLVPEDVYAAAHRAAGQLIPGEVFIISLLDENRPEIEFVYFMDRGLRVAARRIPADQGLSGYILRTGQPLRVDDLEQAPFIHGVHLGSQERVRSILAVPLRAGDRPFGMISIQGYAPHAYSLNHERILSTLANQVSAALARAQLVQWLQASEERFRQLAENIQQVIWLTDAAHNQIIYISPAYEVVWGRTCQSLYDQPDSFLEAVHPDDLERVRASQAQQSQGTYDIEYRITRPDGSLRWIWSRAFPIRDERGQVYRIAGISEDVTAHRQAAAALQRSVARLGALRSVDRAILSARSPEEIANTALERVRQLVPCQRAGVMTFDYATGQGIILAVQTGMGTGLTPGTRLQLEAMTSFPVLQQGRTYLVEDLSLEPQRSPTSERLLSEGIRTFLSLPLVSRGEVIGALNLSSAQPAAFSAEQIEVAREVADGLAIAIQQARLLAETTSSLEREQQLNEVARVISGVLDLPSILESIVRLGAQLVGADGGAIHTFGADQGTLMARYLFNFPRGLEPHPRQKGVGMAWQIVLSRKPFLLSDYASHPNALPDAVQAGLRGYIGVPITSGEAVLGSLSLFSLNPVKRFDQRDLALAESVGRQAGIAIQNAQLFAETAEALAREQRLNEVARALSGTLDEATIFASVTRLAGELVGSEVCAAAILSADGQTVHYPYFSNQPGWLDTRPTPRGQGLAGRIIETGELLLIEDYASQPNTEPGWLQAGVRTLIAVPIAAGQARLGALGLFGLNPEHIFTQRELALAESIGRQAGVALQNARLFTATQRQLDELRVLHAVAEAGAEATDEDVLIERATQVIGATLFPDSFGCLMLDEAAGVLRSHASYRGLEPENMREAIPLGGHITGRVAQTGQPWRLPDVRREPAYLPSSRPILSELAVPMKTGDRLLGVLNAESLRQDAFSEDDERLLATLASHLAQAIERLRAEAEVRRLNADLEQRVADRTAQLEAANRELEAFSYSVSHDLRSPLRALDGFSRILLDDYIEQLDADGQQHLRRIRQNAQRMGELIDDLLAFSRLGRQTLNRQLIRPGALVQEAIEELRHEPADQSTEVRVDDLPECWADPRLLKQVWINLLANAFKFTRGRRPARIDIGCLSQAGSRVYFVRDNGAGFDMQYAGKLFGVFQRLHRDEEYEGTGVGLAICQRVIHRHGGHIWAEAAVDQGATFYFTLAEPETA